MKLVILDRDGTINEDRDDYVKSPKEWLPLPGALEAIARLNQAGWHVVLATNQSGLGRGLFDVDALNAIHIKMHKLLAAVGGRIDAVFYCPHRPEDTCDCRKPRPGLFTQILKRYTINPIECAVHTAGDTLRDLQAGVAAGCVPHLVLTGKALGLRGNLQPGEVPVDFPKHTCVHDDLAAFAQYVINNPS